LTRTIVVAIFGALMAAPIAARHGESPQPTATSAVSEKQLEDFAAVRGTVGYWRLAQTRQGVWWYLSPDDRVEFLNSVTTVQPFQAGRAGDDYVSADFKSRDLHRWAEGTLAKIHDAGFKGLGAWCNPVFHQMDVPMTRDLNLSQWARGCAFGSRGWRDAIEAAARRQVAPLRENKNLVGYFIDNELDWYGVEDLAEEYFRVTTAAIRKYDPNHLILGVRYKGWAPAEVVRASRKYVDAQSINYYAGDALLDGEVFAMIHRESGQAIVVSEYSFHALDGRSGDRNNVGFPGEVANQAARAEAYRTFTTRLARVPYIVGADWFQWNDEPGSGRKPDGEDVNFGVTDTKDRPYELLVSAVRETTPMLNPVHEKSGGDDGVGIYRRAYARGK
jgi:hypothetical protein